MKLEIVIKIFLLAIMFMCVDITFALGEDDSPGQKIEIITEFSYHAGPGDSKETAFALAIYGAKHLAVVLSADHLSGMGLLNDFGNKKMAIFCLVTEGLQFSKIDELFSEQNNVYMAKIKSMVSLSDFVKAESRNGALERKDLHLSLKGELDPDMPTKVDPAQELSKAYRYIGAQHWRMALIYLDRLEKKYPYWGDLFLAKSLGFQGMNESGRVREALSSACNYRNHEACVKLKAIKLTN